MISTKKTGTSAARCNSQISSLRLASGLSQTIHSARRASGVILPMIAGMLLLIAMPKMGRAQCPSAPDCPTFPGDCNTWAQVCVTTSMDGSPLYGPDSGSCGGMPTTCCLTMTFCYECCHGVVETVLDQIIPGSNCTGVTPQQMINFAAWYASIWSIYEYMGGGGACDPKLAVCPTTNLEVELYTASCWKNLLAGNIYQRCVPDSACYCQTAYNVCWNPLTNSLDTSNYNTTQVGSCSCTTPPPPGIPWTPGVCYEIDCPNGHGGQE